MTINTSIDDFVFITKNEEQDRKRKKEKKKLTYSALHTILCLWRMNRWREYSLHKMGVSFFHAHYLHRTERTSSDNE